MRALRETWREYREAVTAFSPPARRFLFSEFLAWCGHGVFQVLFNLYLIEGHYQEGFVGRVVAVNGLALALCALPAGLLADRWGRKRTLVAGAVIEGASLLVRALTLSPATIYAASFLAGAGQALLAVAAAPFLAEHSTPRERTHLFSAFFATSLLAGVVGSLIGGSLPAAMLAVPAPFRPEPLVAYRIVLALGAAVVLAAALPLLGIRDADRVEAPASGPPAPGAARALIPVALTSFMIGAGAGLVIPFMNLYFANRFGCASGQIGLIFSIAQVLTAATMLLGPVVARRFGQLRTALAFQLGSIPFLVTLGFERHLAMAAGAFWARASLMQGSTPLVQAFVMETLPPALRARCASLNNMVWNVGWAVSATGSGLVIERFGYAAPFYVTAVLYSIAAVYFYASYRDAAPVAARNVVPEEAKGQRGEGPFTE